MGTPVSLIVANLHTLKKEQSRKQLTIHTSGCYSATREWSRTVQTTSELYRRQQVHNRSGTEQEASFPRHMHMSEER